MTPQPNGGGSYLKVGPGGKPKARESSAVCNLDFRPQNDVLVDSEAKIEGPEWVLLKSGGHGPWPPVPPPLPQPSIIGSLGLLQ